MTLKKQNIYIEHDCEKDPPLKNGAYRTNVGLCEYWSLINSWNTVNMRDNGNVPSVWFENRANVFVLSEIELQELLRQQK